MKKILAAILAIVYLSTSLGATIHLHYCMGRLVSWGLMEHAGKSCDFCGMRKMRASGECMAGMKNCCHEESKQIKIGKDQKTAQEFSLMVKTVPAVADLPRPVWMSPVLLSPVFSQPVSHGPPLVNAMPVFLRNCNFRI
ncbi:MAG TPA: hypothetical protein VG605_16220 [Puia sp.]|jgi:hypothetical protein|nr:hypothetical protein [Puia sp.]